MSRVAQLHAGALIGAGVGGQHGAAQGTADVRQHRHLSALQVSHPFFVTQGAAMLNWDVDSIHISTAQHLC